MSKEKELKEEELKEAEWEAEQAEMAKQDAFEEAIRDALTN